MKILTAVLSLLVLVMSASSAVLAAGDATAPAPVAATATATGAGIATVASDGGIELSFGGKNFATLDASLADQHWAFAAAQPAGGGQRFVLTVPDHADRIAFTGQATVSATSATATAPAVAAVSYALTAAAPGSYNTVNLSLNMASADFVGGSWSATASANAGSKAVAGTFPTAFGELGLFNGTIAELRLADAAGRVLTIAFPEPTQVLLQDDRKWGPSFTVRIRPQAVEVKAGDVITIAVGLTSPAGVATEIDHDVVISSGDEWIALHPALDIVPGSALDWSGQGFAEGPTAKHGRVVTVGSHFAFADDAPGTVRRFYGVNLCFTAQYLDPDQADRLADRLLRLGYNAVRIHHYDNFLVQGDPATATWDVGNRDRLDYLLAAFAKRGIYVTTDLYVSRGVSPQELGLTGPGAPKKVNFKVAVPVLPAAYADWCAFARGLLDHVNPYTHARLADDPTLGWLAMINEDNFEDYYREIVQTPLLSEAWKKAWNAWLARTYDNAGGHGRANLLAAWGAELTTGEDPAAGTVELPGDLGGAGLRTSDAMRFLADTETDMFTRMAAFIRDDLKCRALLSDSSSWWNRPVNQAARTHFDYVDDHFYVDHPRFLEQPWRLPSRNNNRDPLDEGAPGGLSCLFTRLLDKPATITEFNYAAPGRYRGMGGLLTGALAGFQDLGGVWRFAYSHSREAEIAPLAMSYFNLCSDPLAQAGDRAAISLFLRGDLAPAPHRLALTMTPADLATPPAAIPTLAPHWSWMGWLTGVGTQVGDDRHHLVADAVALPLSWAAPVAGTPAAYGCSDDVLLAWARQTGAVAADNPSRAGHLLTSDGGAITIDRDHGSLRIDTARTAGGFAHTDGAFTLPGAGMTVSQLTTDATVFAVALDRQPLRQSARILVTHLTDLQDSGEHFAETARSTLLAWGTLPYLVHAGAATVSLTLPTPAAYTVWRLGVDGTRLGQVPTRVTATTLAFTATVAAPEGACMLYEVATGN